MDSSTQAEELPCWIGIDLGTTNSVVAIERRGKPEVLCYADSNGSTIAKSCVYFEPHNSQILVGSPAYEMRFSEHAKNMIYDAKSVMGIRFNTDCARRFGVRVPFNVVNCGGYAGFELRHDNKSIRVRPQEIGAKILAKQRAMAEERMGGREFAKAVITVPATFTQQQLLATIEAGKMVFDEVHLIKEAVAAAYAFGYHRDWLGMNGHKYLVYDFGGGTFDACIIYVERNEFHARCLSGDRELGGGDLDRVLRDHCAKQIQSKYGIDCSARAELNQDLLDNCEKLKSRLSERETDSISLNFLGIYERLHVTRECFEELCMPLLQKTIGIVQTMMAEAKLTPADIDQVLLTGGTSKMPLVAELFENVLGFRQNQLNRTVNGMHANAEGAAIVGAQIGRHERGFTADMKMKLVESTTLSLGLLTGDNVFSAIIPRNEQMPCKREATFVTCCNDQRAMRFEVYEGERKLASENSNLGRFNIHQLSDGAAGDVRVNVSFEVDQDGILKAVASHKDSLASLKLDYTEVRADYQQVEEAIRAAELHWAEDNAEANRQRSKYNLKTAIERAKYHNSNNPRVMQLCGKADVWLNANGDEFRDAFERELKQFRRKLAKLIS